MTLSAAEQYELELINRARLDPAGEAARYGIDLNAGLTAGTISTASKQVLAPNALLENAAIAHSQWMLAADVFSHTGSGGSTPSQRATAAGYSWANVGENLSWRGTTGTIDMNAIIPTHHEDLFRSAGHRQNMMNGAYQEVGIAQERGGFLQGGRNYDSSMLAELFGKPTIAKVFVTGVAYSDTDRSGLYSIGEGVGGVTMVAQGQTATTAAAGGYALALTAGSTVAMTGHAGNLNYAFSLDLSNGNVKADIVNGAYLLTSGSVVLDQGIHNIQLLGNLALFARGTSVADDLVGNAGANRLEGWGGNDLLRGMGGNDMLFGLDGNDSLFGGDGNDVLVGGAGNDIQFGGAGVDMFVFYRNPGLSVVADFSLASGEKLAFDDAIWGNTAITAQQVVSNFAHVVGGNVVFQFTPTETVTLLGVTSVANLASALFIV